MNDVRLIVFSGLPGSGKSTLAEQVSKKIKIPIFSVDPIESAIIKSGIEKSFETGYAAYLVAENMAIEQLKLGISVIIDAVNSVKEAHEIWINLAKKYNVKLFIIECVCTNLSIHKERIESRTRNIYGIPEVTWSDVEKRRNEYLNWDIPHLVVDTNQNNNFEKIMEYIFEKNDKILLIKK